MQVFMPYNENEKYYMITFNEINGELEYTHRIIVQAKNEAEANKKAKYEQGTLYIGESYFEGEDCLFFDGQIALSIESVEEITSEQFFNLHLQNSIDCEDI